jgi:hypothetical protein
MDRKTWIVLGMLLALIILGGVGMVAYSREETRRKIRRAFLNAGLDPLWGSALARQESNLINTARVLTGTDGGRGGAWGPLQITLKTARGWGFTGDPELLHDPEVAAALAVKAIKDARITTLEDLGSFWNAGQRWFSKLPADHVTRVKYVPSLLAHYQTERGIA